MQISAEAVCVKARSFEKTQARVYWALLGATVLLVATCVHSLISLAMNGPAPPSADNADLPPDLLAAFQKQLGLKLESVKAPVDVLVIDRVEKPSEN